MIRLDKYLVQLNIGSRSRVKDMIKKGMVTVDGVTAVKGEMKIEENTACVLVSGKRCVYEKYVYYMLHKPAGVVSATKDYEKTVLDLLPEDKRKNIFPVGRLDKDTEGLLILTNDGELAHRLLAPKRHVDKTYLVRTKEALSKEEKEALRMGVDIGERQLTQEAEVVDGTEETEIYLTIREGKFHQIKRMLHAVSNEVIYLKRISMAGLSLDEKLSKGEYRTLTKEEIQILQEA